MALAHWTKGEMASEAQNEVLLNKMRYYGVLTGCLQPYDIYWPLIGQENSHVAYFHWTRDEMTTQGRIDKCHAPSGHPDAKSCHLSGYDEHLEAYDWTLGGTRGYWKHWGAGADRGHWRDSN